MIFGCLLDSLAEKGRALESVRDFGTGQAEPGFGHVHKTDDAVHRHARLIGRPEVFPFLGDSHNERAMCAAGVEEPLAARHHPAVIRVVDDDRILIEAVLLEFIKNLFHAAVHALHGGGVFCIVPADSRKVRMIGVESHLGGPLLVTALAMRPALVAGPDIVDTEEGLPGFARFPSVLLFLVIRPPAVVVLAPADIVIGLTWIRAVIPGRCEQIGVVLNRIVRNVVAAAHRLRTV